MSDCHSANAAERRFLYGRDMLAVFEIGKEDEKMTTETRHDPRRASVKVTRAGWYALTLVSAAQAISLLDRQILSILAPSIREDLQIGDAELGLLYGTVFALFYALFSLPLGRLVDGWVRTRLLAICLAGWSLFAGLSAFASSFLLLTISRLGVGIGEGAAQPAANSIIFDEFPREKRGTAMAAMGVAIALGLGLSMTLGGIVAQWWDTRFAVREAPLGFSGWQFAFLVAAAPGLPLAWLISRVPEPRRGGLDQVNARQLEPRPFRASVALLGAVTPGANWFMLWHRNAGARQWTANLLALMFIAGFCWAVIEVTQGYSPRPPLYLLGVAVDPHILQWCAVSFGLFVVFNLFQSFKLNDPPAYRLMLSPSLILLMVIGGLQTSINYGVMGFTPSFLVREYGLSLAETGLQFGLLSAALGMAGPIAAGPLTDWLTDRLGARGRVWLMLFALGISPFFGVWTYSAETVTSFYLRFVTYSLILTLWVPPLYAQILELVLPRMRGITFSTYTIIMTLLGLGMGPYFVGIVSDRNGGDLGQAIRSINVVAPAILVFLLVVLWRVNQDESTVIERARAAGEPV